MKKIWTPIEVEQKARQLKEALERLTHGKYGYREAHTYVRSDRRDARQTDENQGLRISTSHVSDPTGEMVLSQEQNRQRLEDVAVFLDEAVVAVDTALARVRAVFSSPDDYYQPLKSFGR